MWVWLNKVVGWSDVDKSGSNWDNPTLAGASDGATDASDPEIFNSATGGFSGIDPSDSTKRYYLVGTGFTDSTDDGFYLIGRVESDNQIRIRKNFSGVHTDGLPLSETGVTWRVEEFKDLGGLPAVGDWWVLGGTGVGGTFHLYCLSDNSPTWSQDKFQISPYDDWDAIGHAWDAPPRYTAFQGNWNERYDDRHLLFGVADLTHAVFWTRGYDFNNNIIDYPNLYYFGDMNPFRPTQDTRPVICIARQADSNWNTWKGFMDSVGMIGSDGTQTLGRIIVPTVHGSSSEHMLDNVAKTQSKHSGKVFRHPLVVVCRDASYAEIRGTLKSLEGFHRYGGLVGSPFGTSRDRLRLQFESMPWNGSKQFVYIY
jgi:hypothetical protein